ncbi:hypothetical protein EI164_00550 [Psychrobacter sp. FME13]|uniref:hypothetical protein n=1 Tax=Psychrobacter sp. FME13 TaxID=2487708 RepID=UPI001787849E|nr:hypothetical protein [Psychrobacter sp. FME13]MBE0440569.1 hypothetical protein [Psychrobacter sp. FME13]
MSEYQQDQASWEWMDQEEQHWFANNISEQASEDEKQMMGQMLAQFDSVFGLSEESN